MNAFSNELMPEKKLVLRANKTVYATLLITHIKRNTEVAQVVKYYLIKS